MMTTISAGFLVRSQVHNLGGTIHGKDTTNGDVYLVASKTITALEGLPILYAETFRTEKASGRSIASAAPITSI
jgi:hypothetical protein